MLETSRSLLVLILLNVCLLCGCGNDSTSKSAGSFPVVVFSDVHFNPYYDSNLVSQLVAADPGEWAGIFKTSPIKAPSIWGADSNYPSLVLALSGIKQNLGTSPLVIYTGDILGHNFSPTFFNYYYGNLGLPVPSAKDIETDAVAVAAMEDFAAKTVSFFVDQVRSSVGSVPVMFALGNADSFIGAVPEPSFLLKTADLFYTKFLNSSLDHQEFLTTFENGGYYSAEPSGTNLMVVGLNTTMFVPYLEGIDKSVVDAELAWLDSRLAAAKTSGKKVWLLMHVPPGADIASTAGRAGSNGQITTATMMWDQVYQATFMKTVAKYPGVITLTLAAHTHMDEYRIYSGANVLEITPSITPVFGNNPAFKVLVIDQVTLSPTDYTVLNYDLATNPPQFNSYYTFSTAYSMQGSLDVYLAQLYPALATNKAQQALYRGHYFSGHNYTIPNASTVPNTKTYNPVTDADWPVYWSGIGIMDPTALVNSVNSYR
jgi:hypothetical protein